MGKLHEVLAVVGDLEGVATKILEEAEVTFSKKADHFVGSTRTLKMFDADRANEEADGFEQKELVTTVQSKLDYVAEHLVRYIDAVAQKEATNQAARADVVVNGMTILKEVPATLLLSLENKLARWRKMYAAIPTLQPGVKWADDPTAGMPGVFKSANDVVDLKVEQLVKPVVLYEATKEHPAQVKEVTEKKAVGQFRKEMWSGMWTPARKSLVLGRLDALIKAVKQSRARANETEVVKFDVGETLIGFLHAD
jgi:hypothetical protein